MISGSRLTSESADVVLQMDPTQSYAAPETQSSSPILRSQGTESTDDAPVPKGHKRRKRSKRAIMKQDQEELPMERPSFTRVDTHPVVGIRDFSGNVQRVQADSIQHCVPERKCATFWFHVGLLVGAFAIGIVFVVLDRADQGTLFTFGMSLITLAFGGSVPGPKWSKQVLPTIQSVDGAA